MDQKIFDMGLSVEATSLYLLLVPLSEAGEPPDRGDVLRFWNAGEDELDKACEELMKRAIIQTDQSGKWLLLPPARWS